MSQTTFFSMSDQVLQTLVREAFASCLSLSAKDLACEVVWKKITYEHRIKSRVIVRIVSLTAKDAALDAILPGELQGAFCHVFAEFLHLEFEDVICKLNSSKGLGKHGFEQEFEVYYMVEPEVSHFSLHG